MTLVQRMDEFIDKLESNDKTVFRKYSKQKHSLLFFFS